ncbi:MAG: acyl-ACP--UDP-N-acetylglucosamine O-acyltransferase [Deltaproteobacteria bacterium]|nr:acyl-ACP--UDP-N-acetylglucosamine O-acyltransferase [Deltaproteobacteria bacterium]
MIHPTAIIDGKAELDSTVEVGPYTVIGPHVSIGAGTVIGPHVVIEPYVSISPDCRIYQYAAIGAVPQAVKFGGEKTYVKIGRGSVIREFVTIHRGTAFGGGITELGEENFLMNYTHIAHDCKTGRQVVLANNATLAGHITIGDYASVGGLTAIHQFVRVGDYAFIGGKSAVSKDVPPFVKASGSSGDRAKLYGINSVGLKRHGFSQETLLNLKRAYRIVFRIGLTMREAVERVKAEVEQLPEVAKFIEFLQTSERGITR